MSDVKGEAESEAGRSRNDRQERRRTWQVLRQLPEKRLAKRRWRLPSPPVRRNGSKRLRCRLRELTAKLDRAGASRAPRKEASARKRKRVTRGLPMRTVYLQVQLLWRFASDEELGAAIRKAFSAFRELARWEMFKDILKDL